MNEFTVDYLPSGDVDQFYSDLSAYSIIDGKEISRRTIRVNEPLRVSGVTIYQTNWGINSLVVKLLNDDDILKPDLVLPMADLSKLDQSPFSEANNKYDIENLKNFT